MNASSQTRTSRLETIIDSLDAAVMIVSDHFIVETWNRAATRIFGWSATEAIGRSAFEMFPPGRYADGWSAEGAFDHVIKHDVWRGEAEFERRDGTPFLADITYGVFRDEQGEPDGFFGVFRNITGDRELEIALDEVMKDH